MQPGWARARRTRSAGRAVLQPNKRAGPVFVRAAGIAEMDKGGSVRAEDPVNPARCRVPLAGSTVGEDLLQVACDVSSRPLLQPA